MVKKRKFQLLCFVIVLVSFIPLAYAPNYFESDEIFIRANPNVDIQYADDLYFSVFEMDDSTYVRVNDTVTLFNISSIDASTGVVNFTSSGNDAQYDFTWSPTRPYATRITGEVTGLDVSAFSNDQLTLTVNGTTGETTITTIYCGSKGQPVTITPESTDGGYANGVQTITVTHSSPQEVVVDWNPLPIQNPESSFWGNIYMSLALVSLAPIILVGATLITTIVTREPPDGRFIVAIIMVAVCSSVAIFIIANIGGLLS